VYQLFGVPVADVAKAFRIEDFRPVPFVGLPVNVVLSLLDLDRRASSGRS
jgi:hypothetical protein